MAIRNPLLKAIPAVATKSDPDVESRVELAGCVVGYFRPDSIQAQRVITTTVRSSA